MATILTKKSDTASAVPLAADLTNATGGAELAVNATDKRLFSKTSGGTVVELGTNPSSLTLPNGTANGLAFLNASKVVTSNSIIGFDGTNIKVATSGITANSYLSGLALTFDRNADNTISAAGGASSNLVLGADNVLKFNAAGSEGMRLTSTGLGIGTSSPAYKLDVAAANNRRAVNIGGATTGYLYLDINNTGGELIAGVGDGSTGALFSGMTAYASAIGSNNATPFQIATNGTVRATLDSSGNLGIGTSSPQTKLDVASANTVTDSIGNAFIKTTDTQAADVGGKLTLGGLYNASSYYAFGGIAGKKENSTSNNVAGYLQLLTTTSAGSMVERARIDSSGNLGLGVTPSAWAGGYKASQVVYGALANNGGAFTSVNQNCFYDGSNWKYIINGNATQLSTGNGTFQFNTAASGTAGNAITFTQAMTLTASSELLVNRTSASGLGKLNVEGGADFTAGNVYMCRDSGDVLVGTTSVINSGFVNVLCDATQKTPISIKSSVNAASAYYMRFVNNSGTDIGAIQVNGSNNGVNYLTSSDYRLKENVQPMTGALAKVSALKPCTYTWKNGGAASQGFIAHELQEVVPDCVSGKKDDVDEEGNPKYQGIDTSHLVATLTAAIQELNAKFEAYKASHP